ncbi:MAG TPA: alanine racemase [Vicinamibacterales bacterium]
MNRRTFLAALSAPVVARLASLDAHAGQAALHQRVSAFEPWIEVNIASLRANAAEMARVAGRPVLAVVKNNGYGLGVVNAAQALEPSPAVHGFAVVKLQEARDLRARGIKKPILLMAPIDADDLRDAVSANIMPMVYTPIGDLLDQEAARLGRPIPIHVCVDTGIGRVGVPHRQAAALIRDLAGRKGVAIDGTMMTFTEDLEFDREQRRRFAALTDELKAAGINLGRLHAASTYTLFQHGNETSFDMVRPGMGLLGIYPDARFAALKKLDLKTALAMRVRVAYVKQLAAGESAGYERAYVAKRDTWIATLPVGHADGWPRAAAKGGKVRINGRLYPVIASVSASHTLVEIGDSPDVKAGDVATLFDGQDGSRPEDVAQATGASVYDLTMHLSPLLPRRTV